MPQCCIGPPTHVWPNHQASNSQGKLSTWLSFGQESQTPTATPRRRAHLITRFATAAPRAAQVHKGSAQAAASPTTTPHALASPPHPAAVPAACVAAPPPPPSPPSPRLSLASRELPSSDIERRGPSGPRLTHTHTLDCDRCTNSLSAPVLLPNTPFIHLRIP